jgi:hypothetical protein
MSVPVPEGKASLPFLSLFVLFRPLFSVEATYHIAEGGNSFFYWYIIVVPGTRCDIYKSA